MNSPHHLTHLLANRFSPQLTIGGFVYFDDVLVGGGEKKKGLQKESSQKSEASGGGVRRESGPDGVGVSPGVMKKMGTMMNRRSSNVSMQLSAEGSGLADSKSAEYTSPGAEMKHT